MAACAPHRFLANNRNALLDATTLVPSSVQPVDSSVLEEPLPRSGTAQAALTGSYTGAEEAVYEVEVVSAAVETNRVSVPVRSCAGSEQLANIAATGDPQDYVLELTDPGVEEAAASVEFEGQRIIARAGGTGGNNLNLAVDQSGLVFNTTIYSLLVDLAVGAGAPTTGLEGTGYEWETAVLGAQDQIPPEAKRIAFGTDRTMIYLAYKRFDGIKTLYHFVPEIKRAIPKGTPVYFVTGGRTVYARSGTTVEDTFADIVTVWDLLNAIKTSSSVLDVSAGSVVSFDRSPTGQAAREMLLRTDAHVDPSYGAPGSSVWATGVVDAFAAADAPTELVSFTCFAVTSRDAPGAHLGNELWAVEGSLSGKIGVATTGIPFVHPDGRWGATVARKLPSGYGQPKGRFSVASINMPRTAPAEPPPVCMVAMQLGPNAVDETITLRWTKRPSGDCSCAGMPIPAVDAACLGLFTEGESTMDYSAANRERLENLYAWAADTVRAHSRYVTGLAQQDPFISQPGVVSYYLPKRLNEVVAEFEEILKELNALSSGSPEGALRAAAETAWDTAVEEFEDDVDESSSIVQFATFEAAEDLSTGDAISIFTDVSSSPPVRKARKAIPGDERYGFVKADYSLGDPADVYWWGTVPGKGATPGLVSYMDATVPGGWTEDGSLFISNFFSGGAPLAGTTSGPDILIPFASARVTQLYWALLSDRYEYRMRQVLITGGISPLGKSEANTIQSGDGCWHDWGGDYYWTVTGSERGAYAPAFNNHICYASRISADGRAYYSTKEFCFQPNIFCPELLVPGDEIVLQIDGSGWPPTYQVGDTNILPVVSAQPVRLSGGINASPLQTWYLSGSSDGALPNFVYDPTASPPTRYDSNGIAFDLINGAVPSERGDKFRWSVEGGTWRWRKIVGGVTGSWSSAAAISNDAELLDEGLSLSFRNGAAPSFVASDLFRFRVLQPWAVSNLRRPFPERWQWGEENDPSLLVDLGSAQDLRTVALALHTIPEGATITLEGGTGGSPFEWSEELTWRAGAIVKEFDEVRNARYLRLSLTDAAGGGIGWFWIGMPFVTTMGVDVTLRHQYKIDRGSSGLFQGGLYSGRSVGGTVQWSEGSLFEADMTNLVAMLDWSKSNHDEPFIFVPQIERPQEALLARVLNDEVDLEDIYKYGLHSAHPTGRQFSAALPLSGVWQQ